VAAERRQLAEREKGRNSMRGIWGKLILAVAAGTVGGAQAGLAADTGTLTTLYRFTGLTDGGTPLAGLTYANGALYGTTEIGGTIDTDNCPEGCGTVFSVDPGTGAETVVYSFKGTPDGAFPVAGLTYQNGLLYGTTSEDGPNTCPYPDSGCGTVFAIDPTTGAEAILYSFTKNGKQGEFPAGTLVYQNGTLYGTTEQGGPKQVGNVFAVNATTGAATDLYNFTGVPNGEFPVAGPTYVNGNLFGTTQGFGQSFGTIYEVHASNGHEVQRFVFTGWNGAFPTAGLLYYKGALYGTTEAGGSVGEGTIFSLDLKNGFETVLFNFGADGSDGISPKAGLIEVNGMLYGTTQSGGNSGCPNIGTCGTIFQFDPKSGRVKVLHHFTGKKDEGNPVAGLIYQNGAFYGTTAASGTNGCGNKLGCGTVFKYTP
jgi:uncharacterized repeat protein (TIGR03803 family)